MKDVTTTTPLTKLIIDKLKGCFGGADDEANVLAAALDSAELVVIEELFL